MTGKVNSPGTMLKACGVVLAAAVACPTAVPKGTGMAAWKAGAGGTTRALALLLAAYAVLPLYGCGSKGPGGEAKKLKPPELFRARCSVCHPLERVLEKTDYTAAHWRAVVDNMMVAQGAAKKIGPREAEEIKEFLADPVWRDRLSGKEGGSRDPKQ